MRWSSCVFLSLGLAGCGEATLPGNASWGDPPRPAYTAQARLAITDNGDDTLAFVTPDRLTDPAVMGFAPIGDNPIELGGPHHLAASPDGKYIYYNLSNYVTNGGSGPHGAHGTGTVPGFAVKLDARTNRLSARVLVDRSPGDIIVSPDGKTVFVSHYDLARLNMQLQAGGPPQDGFSKLAIIDAESMRLLSMTPVCPTAHGMGLSPDHGKLYITCSLSDELAVVDVRDVSKPQVLARVKVGPAPGPVGGPAYAPYALRVQSNGLVWLANNMSGDVRVYDPAAGKMDDSRTVHVGGIAMFSDFSPDERVLYVAHQGDDVVTAIDMSTLAQRDLPLPKAGCLNVHVLRVLEGGQRAALVCEGDHLVRKGSVVFLDLGAWTVGGYVQVGLFSDGIAMLPGLP